MAEGSTPVGDVIDALRGLFGAFAAPDKLTGSDHKPDERGVEVLYNRNGGSIVRFRFVTPDDLELIVDVDLNAISKRYIDDLIANIRSDLAEYRMLELDRRRPVVIH